MQLSSVFDFYMFTPGRRILAMLQLRALLDKHKLEELSRDIDEAVAHDRKALELRAQYSTPLRAVVDARPIDAKIDSNLGLIDSILEHYSDATEDPAVAEEARALRRKLFPRNLVSHTALPHPDQLAANNRVLTELKAKRNQALVKRLGLEPHTTKLAMLNSEFSTALTSTKVAPDVTYDEVKAADSHGQELLCGVVARICGRFSKPEDAAKRAELLAPVLAQNKAISAYRQRRRRVADVNPDTGEVVGGAGDDTDIDSGAATSAEPGEAPAAEPGDIAPAT